jgi:type IV secretion system protein VirD4
MNSRMKQVAIRFSCIIGGVTAGLVAATQRQAAMFHYPVEFGPGLDLGSMRLYAPWKFLGWMKLYAHLYPADFAGNLAILVGCAALPALIAIAATGGFNPQGAVRHYGEKAWATLADIRPAKLVGSGVRLGRVFGKFQGQLLTFVGSAHSISVGASRSGKGASHVIPTLTSWPGSVIAYDRKGELWHITADWRKKFSHVMRFEPTDPNTVRWNMLFEVRPGNMEIADIQNIVGVLVDPLGTKAGDLSFWDKSATNFFTAVILHVLYTAPDDKKNLTYVRHLLINIQPTLWAMKNTKHRRKPDLDRPDGLARDADGQLVAEVHPEVLLGATALENMAERVRSDVLSTAIDCLGLWADPMVQYATSWSDFMIGDVVCSENPVSLYIVTPQAHADRLAFLVRVFVRQTVNSLMEEIHHDSRGRRKKHQMLLLLDEFPKLGALPFLENALGEMAGYGITAHLVCQSFNDVFAKYGERTSIFDNMHITATFSTSEPASIKKVIERAGKSLEYRESFSNPRTMFSRSSRSVSYGEQQRYILSEEDVRALDENKQLLFVNNTKPIMADKIRYWEEPWFAERCGDFFGEKMAAYVQPRGKPDRPSKPKIAWEGVRAIEDAPPMPAPPKRKARPAAGPRLQRAPDAMDPGEAAAAADGVAPKAVRLDPARYAFDPDDFSDDDIEDDDGVDDDGDDDATGLAAE